MLNLSSYQSSYTPFITENLYQGLKQFIPEDSAAGDTRSVHFLPFPEVKEEYFDAIIERQVKRMQTVIELTRNVRERHNISLKVCDNSHHIGRSAPTPLQFPPSPRRLSASF